MRLIVGRVRKPQGIRGELLVEPLTDAPEDTFVPGRELLVDDGRKLTVKTARAFKDAYVIAFEEIGDRNAAEEWRGRSLLAHGDELAPLEADEVYRHDLIGMRVRDAREGDIGTVEHVYDLPTGLMLEIARGEGRVLVPYKPVFVKSVDVDARVVHIDAPEGLLE